MNEIKKNQKRSKNINEKKVFIQTWKSLLAKRQPPNVWALNAVFPERRILGTPNPEFMGTQLMPFIVSSIWQRIYRKRLQKLLSLYSHTHARARVYNLYMYYSHKPHRQNRNKQACVVKVCKKIKPKKIENLPDSQSNDFSRMDLIPWLFVLKHRSLVVVLIIILFSSTCFVSPGCEF